MSNPTPAAGGLSDAEVEFVYDWTPDDPGKRREMAEELSHIIAARTEAADREVARVTAAVEALIAAHVRVTPLASGSMIDAGIRASDREWARALRAALSSADTATLDRERAKAAAEALREAADEWDRRDEEHLHRLSAMALERYQAGGPSMPAIWLRDRAAAVSPEGGDA